MTELRIRTANAADASAISDVLIRSITQLCAADHLNDPKHLSSWIEAKTPAHMLEQINGPHVTLVSEVADQIGAVGQYSTEGMIQLLYVAPEARGQGHSSALLSQIETDLADLGFEHGKLVSSRTALAFYQQRGWCVDGPEVTCYTTDGQPLKKLLVG